MSRVTSGDLVMMSSARPRKPSSTSRIRRVSRNRRSAGWYGSVAVPMTSEWPPSRAGSSVRASTSATPVFTRMRRSNASHAGIGSAGAPLRSMV